MCYCLFLKLFPSVVFFIAEKRYFILEQLNLRNTFWMLIFLSCSPAKQLDSQKMRHYISPFLEFITRCKMRTLTTLPVGNSCQINSRSKKIQFESTSQEIIFRFLRYLFFPTPICTVENPINH